MKKSSPNQWPSLGLALGLALTVYTNTAGAVDQTKADNATALDQTGSWVGNAVPGSGDRAIWDGTLSAANCTNSAGSSTLNVGQIQIKSPSGGVPLSIIGSSAWWRLYGVNGAAIDMSTATVDLTIGSGFTIQPQNTGTFFTNQAGRTLTINGGLYVGSSAGKSLILDGGGNYVFSALISQGNLTGSGTLIKQGAGAVTIATPNYNTNFVLNAGTFNVNQNFAVNGNAGSFMTINGGTIDNTSGGTIALTANPPTYFWNGDFTFAGTGNLNLGGGSVTLGGNRQVTCNANTLTVGGVISDGSNGYSLTKAGAGTLTLSGANTYSGNTTVSAGTLVLSGSGSIASSTNISAASGAAFDVSGLSAALTLSASQTLKATATGANTTATIKGAASRGLTLSTGGLVFTAYGGGGTAPLTASGAAGAVNLNGAPVTVTTTTALTANTYTLIDTASSGTVTGTPGTLTVNGSGLAANMIASIAVTSGKLVLTVAATAQVKADNATSLNQGGSWVSATAPGSSQWAIWNGSYTAANLTNAIQAAVTWGGIQISNVSPTGVPITITNDSGSSSLNLNGIPNGGGGVAVDMSSATDDLIIGSFRVYVQNNESFNVGSGRTLSLLNNLQLQSYALTLNGAGNYKIPGQIFGTSSSAGALVMNGTGSLTLSAANYCYLWTNSSGTLTINHNYAISGYVGSSLTVAGGALDTTVNGTSLGNTPALNLNGDFSFAGTYSLNYGTGAVTLGGNRQVTVSANTLTLGGVIGDGGHAYSLTKAGSGTLTLSGANTYTGNTTVSAGTLALSGSGAIASSNLTVASGATLDVSGLTTALALGSGQTLKATATGANTTVTINGAASRGLTLSTGGLVFTAYGGGGTAPLTASGAAGAVNLNGAPVTVTTTTALTANTYTLIDTASSGTVTGTPGTLTVNGSGLAANMIASVAVTSGKLVLTVAATAQVKADNATSLDQGGSWVSATAPGSSQWAIWNGTYAAANLTNAIQANVTWGGIQISNVSPTGVPITLTNDAGNHSLNLNGIGGVAIDMSSATDDLFLGSSTVQINNNVSFNVAASRTLTLDQIFSLGSYTLTLNGAGNYIKGANNRFYSSGAGALVMNGSGSLTLVGPNNSLFTTLNSGTMNLKHAFAYSGAVNSTLTINGGLIDNTSGSAMTILQSPTNVWNGDFSFVGSYGLDLGSGPVILGGNRQVTVTANTLTVDGVIGDGGHSYSLTKAGAGTLTLTAADTYSGNTTVSAGTLALSGGALITNTPTIVVAGNAIFNVSGLSSPFALASALTSQTLSNSSAGAILNGTNNCSTGTIALVYDGVNPSFTLTNGGMALSSSTTFKINNTGAALGVGSYRLIAKATTGNLGLVAGTVPSVTLGGSGKSAGTGTPALRIDANKELYLDIPPAALTLGNGGPICAGNTLNLTANTVSGGTYAWTGPNGFTASSQNPSIANATAAASGTYHCTVTVSGVTSADATTAATVNALPTPTAGNNGSVCVGSPLSLTSSGGVGYTWSGPNGFSSTAQNPTVNASAILAMAGTYTVTVTNASGCTAQASTTVSINALPSTSGIAGTNSVQQMTSATYSVANTAGSSYGWTVPAGASFTGGTGHSISVTFGTTSGNVSVIETNASGCTGTQQSRYVTVITCTAPTIAGGIDASATNLCAGNPVILTLTNATGTSPLTYQWQTNGTTVLNATNASYTNSAVSDTWDYACVVTNACGSITSSVVTVTVNPTPATTGISGSTTMVHGSTHAYSVVNTAGSTYGWSVPAGASYTGGLGNSISVTFGTTGGNVTVTETNASGCTGTQQTLAVTVAANTAPTANTMNVLRTPGEPLVIALSDLATNWNDADGDLVQMTAFNGVTTNGMNLTPLYLAFTNGAYLTSAGGLLGYTNVANVNDQFTYSVGDGFGGTNIGYVNIVVSPFVTGTQTISGQQTTNVISGSSFTVTYYGIPGYTYLLERSTNLTDWVGISTNTIGSGGVTNVIDSFSGLPGVPSSAYYRVGWQPSY